MARPWSAAGGGWRRRGLARGSHFGDDANVQSVLGPAVSDSLWGKVQAAVAGVGLRVTVDAFASESNSRAPRFWSRFGEPGCEAEDALSVGDWEKSRCPSCGRWHSEVVYAFPPYSLMRRVMRKALADRAVMVLVVPVATIAPHWSTLVRCSLLRGKGVEDGYLRVRSPGSHLRFSEAPDPKELAVFVCDFALAGGGDPPDRGLSPACAGAYARRPRPLCGSVEDAADRRRLREQLLAARSASVTGSGWQS